MNKGELRVHFKDLLNRSDLTDTLADTFVDQSITRIQRQLRIPSMEKTFNYSITSSTTSLTVPADFLEVLDFYHTNTNIQRIPLSTMVNYKQGGEAGTPQYFARQGDEFLIYPYPSSGTAVLNYYAQFTDMTADTDENDLAIIAPDLITYGALSYASDYFMDERGPLFEQRFSQFLSELQGQADDAETSGSVQSIMPSRSLDN